MEINRAYKTELDPTREQRRVFLRHSGAARFAFNLGLRMQIEHYQRTGKRLSLYTLQRELNALKAGELSWMYEVSKCAPETALRHLDAAFQHFFRRVKAGEKAPGFPRFKSRSRGIGSFTLRGAIQVAERGIKLPRIGWVRLKEHGYLPEWEVHILGATVSERAGRWFVCLQVREFMPKPEARAEPVVGVDVGIQSLAVTSEGEVFENPKALRGAKRRLRQLQKTVSRRQRGSKNRAKAKAALAKAHYRVGCIRGNALHQASHAISEGAGTVVLEDLNVAGMMRNHSLAGALADASFAELHRQIEYKQEWTGGQVLKAGRWEPSSKRCSACKAINQGLTLKDRTFRCPSCGFTCDRDENAGRNLKQLAAGAAPPGAKSTE